jgi:hypothetical protein
MRALVRYRIENDLTWDELADRISATTGSRVPMRTLHRLSATIWRGRDGLYYRVRQFLIAANPAAEHELPWHWQAPPATDSGREANQ